MSDKIDRLFACFSPAVIEERIHRPIDRAAETFENNQCGMLTHEIFNDNINRFVDHMYKKANIPRLGEIDGIWLLEQYYLRNEPDGYVAAYLDACDKTIGMQIIFEALTEIIKEVEEEKYIESVLTRCVDPTNMDIKREISHYVIEKLNGHIPEAMITRSSAELANEWEKLLPMWIRIYINLQSQLD